MRYSCGDIKIDTDSHMVSVCGKRVNLTKTEYELLLAMASSPGVPLSQWHLINAVWRLDPVEHGTIKVHMHNLREKVGRHRVLTIYGKGYMLSTSVTECAQSHIFAHAVS